MLTADLVQIRKLSGRIEIPAFTATQTRSLHEAAQKLIATCKEQVGHARGDLLAQWDALTQRMGYPKQVRGLRKLLLDRCTFADDSEVDPRLLRKALFTAAARHRFQLADNDSFHATEVFSEVSQSLSLDAEAIRSALYSDLKENHLLMSFDALKADHLVTELERSQRQAVLLRAIRVKVTLRSSSASEYRLFFQRLKFRRLLHTITPLKTGGYEITIDGPFSLFQSVTKYGLQLALMLPVLEECQDWELDADISWGKSKERYDFHLSGKRDEGNKTPAGPWVSDDVNRLREQIRKLTDDWHVENSQELLNLPGLGICVPDLRFEHKETGLTLHLEVMGYWSRDAVWKRVELVEAGLPDLVIFAVGRRLRVSEAVLSDDLPSQIYVYKGVMSPKEILKRLNTALVI